MGILVLNTGSSSLKFSLFDDHAREVHFGGQVDWHGNGRPAELIVRAPGQPERLSFFDATDPGAAFSYSNAGPVPTPAEGVPSPLPSKAADNREGPWARQCRSALNLLRHRIAMNPTFPQAATSSIIHDIAVGRRFTILAVWHK